MIGVPTAFVRTTGCNLECHWCDTKFALREGKEMVLEEVLRHVDEMDTHFVCVTGGEPLLQEDTISLLETLLDRGHHVTLETNGSLSLEDLPCSEDMMVSMDLKCPSSGMEGRMLTSNLELLSPVDQLKFVVADRKDLHHAHKVLSENDVRCNVVFTPVGGLDLRPVAEFVLKQRINARVLPQLHKLIWGDARGV
jgi:7-carboxy-7-deazaguanine synthase